MSRAVLKQIADLERMTTSELQDRWLQLVGSDPPRYSREFLIRRLAYRIQELAHGGIALSTREKMNRLLDDGAYDEIGALKTNRREPQRKRGLAVLGTRLVREWNGERHEVTAVEGGFEFQGRRYRSLSAIAKLITGTHWSGPSFFGLRPSKDRRADQ
jgi:hypothetical protein